MKDQWLAMEHYRLRLVEDWPDGPRKEAALEAIRSSIESLSWGAPKRSLTGDAVAITSADPLQGFRRAA